MGRQRPFQVLAIKKRVRRRDGNCCVVCRIDEYSHEKRYGKILDVHRIVPRTDYSINWGVCVTLCEVCHDALHGNGHWGWIATHDLVDEEQLAAWVRRPSYRDLDEEEGWRKREVWGSWLKELRSARLSLLIPKRKPGATYRRRKRVSPIARFAMLSDLSVKALLDFEAGRREPLLSEAKKLSAALNITLDELATEKDSDGGWQPLCKERSHLRALVFRACQPEEEEVNALSRAARLVWELVGKANEKRAEEWETARRAEENLRREMLAKQRPVRFRRLASLKAGQTSRATLNSASARVKRW